MIKLIAGTLLLLENVISIAFLQTLYIPIYFNPDSPLYRTEMYGPVSGLQWFVYAFGICAAIFGLLCISSGLKDLWPANWLSR